MSQAESKKADSKKNSEFKKNSKVQWSWLGKKIDGVVEETFTKTVTKTIKQKKITRHGSPENPAYLVKSEAGNFALKLQTELSKPQKRSSKSKPRMFDS